MNKFRPGRLRMLLYLLASAALVGGVGYGQSDSATNSSALKPQAAPTTDLSGIWEPERGRGRPGTPAAELTPEAKAAAQASRAKQQEDTKAGNVVPYVSRWCMNYGMPFMMHQSPPIDIVQGENEVGVYSEQINAPRHIYLDGRTHPDEAHLVRSTNGHSIGHWEGDTLVVDTMGFNDRGLPMIGGGGNRTSHSHLVEHFKLLPNGNLSITSTWDDPTVFVKPFTTTAEYHRMPAGSYPEEEFCDASQRRQTVN
jgi:hypothetical protein